MEKAAVFGTVDGGSIPSRGTRLWRAGRNRRLCVQVAPGAQNSNQLSAYSYLLKTKYKQGNKSLVLSLTIRAASSMVDPAEPDS